MALSKKLLEKASALGKHLAENRLCVVAGAGICRDPPAGLPDWRGLASELDQCLGTGLEAKTFDNPLEAMTVIERLLATDPREARKKLVRAIRKVVPSSSKPTKVHSLLLTLGCPIYTTNIDGLFEKAACSAGVPIQVVRRDTDVPSRGTGARLIKLHGDLNACAPEDLVLNEADYNSVIHASRRRAVFDQFRADLEKTSVLFVGHSGTDPDLRCVLHYIDELLGTAGRKAWLLTADASRDRCSLMESRGFQVIQLKDYRDVPDFLARVRRDSEAARVTPTPAPPHSAEPVKVIEEAWRDEAEEIGRLFQQGNFETALESAKRWETRVAGAPGVSEAVVSQIHRIKAICHRELFSLAEAQREIELATEAEPGNIKNKLEQAQIAIARGDEHLAKDCVRGTQGIDARRIRATVAFNAGNVAPVQRLLRTKKAGNDANCQAMFARYYLARGLSEKAVSAAEKTVELAPGPRSLEFAGNVHFAIGTSAIQRALREKQLLLSDIVELPMDGLVDVGAVRSAVDFYQRAFEAFGKKIDKHTILLHGRLAQSGQLLGDGKLLSSVEDSPTLPSSLERLTRARDGASSKSIAECVQELTRACWDADTCTQTLLSAARVLIASKRPATALRILDAAAERTPDDLAATCHWHRANALLRSRGLSAALAEILKAKHTPHGMAAVWLYKARLYAAAGRGKDALRWFRKVLKTGRLRISALYYSALFASSQRQDHTWAAELLSELIQILPSVGIRQDFARHALLCGDETWFRRGFAELRQMRAEGIKSQAVLQGLMSCYQAEKDWQEARQVAEEYLTKWPDDLGMRSNYALFLARSRRFEDALAELQRVRTQAPPEQEDLLFGLAVNEAQILLEAERYDAGYRAARLACDRFPQRPEPWVTLLRACELAGREAELGATAAELHRRFPDHPAVEVRRGVKALVRLVRSWDQRSGQMRLAYLSGQIPIHLLAEATNLPLTALWAGFSRNERIVSGVYTPPLVDAEADRIRDTQGIVLDYTALLTIDALGLWHLINHLPPLVISNGLAERLRDDQHRLRGKRRPQYHRECEEIKQALSQASGVCIRDRFLKDVLPKSSIDRHGLTAAADLWEAQAESGVVLDDLTKTLPPAFCLRTNQLLHFMRARGWITLSEYHNCIQKLDRWPGHIKSNAQAALASTAVAITTPVIVSRASLESLQQLGILKEIVRRCKRLIISLPTWNYLLGELAQLEFVSEVAGRHERIRQRVARLPCEDVSGTQVRKLGLRDLKMMEASKPDWYLVRGGARLLWSDDRSLRALTENAQQLQGAKTITTMSLLRWLRREGHLSDEAYHRAVCELVRLRYEYIMLEVDTLRWAMREHNWRQNDGLAEILRYFGRVLEVFGPARPAVGHFFQAFEVLLGELWQQQHLSFQEKLQLADWFCGAILPPRLAANLRTRCAENLVQLMLARMMSLQPQVARPFAVWLTGYVRKQGISAADLSRMLRRHYQIEGTKNVDQRMREAWQAQFLLRLPVFLRLLVPAEQRARRKPSQPVTLSVWSVRTPAGAFRIADPDLTMLAEREVACRGPSAIGRKGTVDFSFRPAQVAMTTEEHGEPRWASVPEEIEDTVHVPVHKLLKSGDVRVRELAAQYTARRIAMSRSALADRARELLAATGNSGGIAGEVSKLLCSPAVQLAVLHGRQLTEGWFVEFASTELRSLHRCYRPLLAAHPRTALTTVACWARAVHELPPPRGYFGSAARKLSTSKRGQLLRLLIKVLRTTHDPFAFGGALEAVCEITSQGRSLGPKQLLAVRKAVNSAFVGFPDDKTRCMRLEAFVEILRATSWVVMGRAGDGPEGKTKDALNIREHLNLILPVARDIARVLGLGRAGRGRTRSIAQLASNFANERVVAALQNGGTTPLRDAADHRCTECRALISAVIADVLSQDAVFARHLADTDTVRSLATYLSVPLSPRSQPRRTTNKLDIFPSQTVGPLARELLFHILLSQKQRARVKAPRIPTLRSIGPAVAGLQPPFCDIALRELCGRLPFMPASAVGKTYQALGGAGCVWDNAERGKPTSLEFCWLAFPLLSRKQRTELADATGRGLKAALDGQNANLALLACDCVAGALAKLRETEWTRLSAAVLCAVRSEVLDESARHRLAGVLLKLPLAVGRLNRELAAQIVSGAFPDLSQQEDARR